MGDNSTDPTDSIDLSRRKILGATGGAFTTGLAGCSSLNSNDSNGSSGDVTSSEGSTTIDDSEGTGNLADDTFDISVIDELTEDLNFNPWDSEFQDRLGRVIFHRVGIPYANGDYQNELLADWEFSGDTRTLTFKEGFTWWNGDPVTAEDYWVEQEINRLQAAESSDFAEHNLVDDYTIEQVYKQEKNPTMVQPEGMVRTPRWIFTEYLERYQDASSQDEIDTITKDLTEMEIGMDQMINDGLGNATYQITSASAQRIIFERYDDHPWAEDVNIPRLRSRMCVEGKSCNQLVNNNRLDGDRRLLSSALEESSPDNIQNVGAYTSNFQYRLSFNQLNKHLQKRRFRQALAYLISTNDVQSVQGYEAQAKEYQSGIRTGGHESWLDNQQEDYIGYGADANPEKAREILTDMGYQPPGSSSQYWTGPDGEDVSFFMPSTSWTLSLQAGNTVSSMLSDFGFNMDFQSLETGKWSTAVYDEATYDMSFIFHQANHPVNFFSPLVVTGNMLGYGSDVAGQIRGWLDQGRPRSPHNGKELIPEIPTEVGADNLDGGSKEFNLFESYNEVLAADSEEATKEFVKDFSWYWNYQVPGIDCTNLRSGTWGDTADWSWPEDENAYMALDVLFYLLNSGQVQAKEA